MENIKKLPTIKDLALHRAESILESWWNEDIGDFQEMHGLSDGAMEEVLSTRIKIVLL